ncbi:MAG: CvpA family protein, partial [Flavobacteriaceae bacterium]
KIGVYILLFVGIAYGVSLAAQAVTKVLKIVALGWLNRLAGGLFGVLKWSLILSALLIVLEQINGVVTVVSPEVIQQSVLYPLLSALGDLLFDWVGEQSVIPNQLI